MAEMIPPTPYEGSPPSIMKLFRQLKQLPAEFRVVQRFTPLDEESLGPEFMVMHGRQVWLIAISAETPQMVGSLFAQAAAGSEAHEKLHIFAKQWTWNRPLPGVIVFPNLQARHRLQILLDTPFPILTRDELKTAVFVKKFTAEAPELTEGEISNLRQLFTPEVVVPESFTVRPLDRQVDAELTARLLDYDQERVLKDGLHLLNDAQDVADDYSVRLVNGVAGSGKSLILIYRVFMIRQLHPRQRILVLTHNRALINDLRSRYEQLSGGDSRVLWHTFQGWCGWLFKNEQFKIISQSKRESIINSIYHEYFSDSKFSATMLMDEISWYKDQLLFSRDDYLEVDRVGRRFPLMQSMREKVYDAMVTYHERLRNLDLIDWSDLPRKVWRERRSKLPQYDAVLIDEGQFFAPLWYALVKSALKDKAHLFIVADPSQGFLKRGQSWLSSGLEVRGRTSIIQRSYRTTREILAFATAMYQARLPEDAEAIAPDLAGMPAGRPPEIISLTSSQDEMTRVINEIAALHNAGVPWAHMLVLHADSYQTRPLTTRLQQKFGEGVIADLWDRTVDVQHKLRVCALDAATGLESPIVFILGLAKLIEQEGSLNLAAEEREELLEENTRRLYMAMTRAGQRVVITYVGSPPTYLTAEAQVEMG